VLRDSSTDWKRNIITQLEHSSYILHVPEVTVVGDEVPGSDGKGVGTMNTIIQ